MANIDLKALESSPFLADVGEKERKIGRLILGIVAGVAAGMTLGLLMVLICAVAYTIQQVASGVPTSEVVTKLTTLIDPKATPTMSGVLTLLGFLALGNGALLGGFAIVAALVQGVKIKSLFTAAPRFRWKLLALGMVMFVALIGPVLVVDVMINGEKPAMPLFTLAHTFGERALYVVIGVAALIVAAGVEELLCRGWLMRQTAAWSRNFWVLVVVNFLIFSLLHLPDVDINSFIARGLMAAGFCYMTLRTGGIEFSTGAHAANNILLLLFVQASPLQSPPPQPFSLGANLTTLVAVLGYVLITEIVVRWTPLRNFGDSLVEQAPLEPSKAA